MGWNRSDSLVVAGFASHQDGDNENIVFNFQKAREPRHYIFIALFLQILGS